LSAAGKRAIRAAVKKRWAAFHAKIGAAKPAKRSASRSFVRVRGSGPLQCDTGERERSP
jgi:hypothetical protein